MAHSFCCNTAVFLLGMCGINVLFRFGFGSVFEKTRIRFGMSLVRFGSKHAVQFGYYSYLLLMQQPSS